MNRPFIIDAHAHIGLWGRLPGPETSIAARVAAMDRLGICLAICSNQEVLGEGGRTGLEAVKHAYEKSRGRIHGLGVFDPRAADRCLGELRDALGWAGLRGIKIHPSMHGTPAESPAYEPVWRFAAEHDLTILTHTWSVSAHNSAQAFSTPERFEAYARQFPTVRLVLAHAGGRGAGRVEALRLARDCANIYLDFAGDIFCHRLIETLVASIGAGKVLFGSDYPWINPEAHLTRILLAPIGDSDKAAILRTNALGVYKLEGTACSQ
jgi:hypothetical protein